MVPTKYLRQMWIILNSPEWVKWWSRWSLGRQRIHVQCYLQPLFHQLQWAADHIDTRFISLCNCLQHHKIMRGYKLIIMYLVAQSVLDLFVSTSFFQICFFLLVFFWATTKTSLSVHTSPCMHPVKSPLLYTFFIFVSQLSIFACLISESDVQMPRNNIFSPFVYSSLKHRIPASS